MAQGQIILTGDSEAEAADEGPLMIEHDVEATTFSNQMMGQALQEAMRSLSDGSALLRYGHYQGD